MASARKPRASEKVASDAVAASDSERGWRLLAPWSSPASQNRWLDRTTWWGTPNALATPQRMLAELLEAIAGRYAGRRLSIDIRGKQLTLILGAVKVETGSPATHTMPLDPFNWWNELPGSREMRRWASAVTGIPVADHDDTPPDIERVVIDSQSVSIDDHPVGEVTAIVDTVRLEYGRVTELVTGPVDLDLHTSRQIVLEWVQRLEPDWNVRAHTGDLLAVDRSNWPITALVRPTVIEGTRVRMDILGVLVFGRTFMLPRRLVRARVLDIPAPADDMELVDASLEGDDVRVHLRHGGLRQPIRPDYIRTAVRDGVSRLTAAAFA
jgi:hypothetical protein